MMRTNLKKLCFLVMAMLFIAAAATGCSSATPTAAPTVAPTVTPAPTATVAATEQAVATATPAEDKPDISKAVELKLVLVSNGAPDTQMVWDEVNKLATKDINATVKYVLMEDAAYKLAIASGEVFDLMPVANWDGYADNARKGAYYEITADTLKKYAPTTAADDPLMIRDAYVDGKLYGLPLVAKPFNYNVFAVRGDFMTKYNIPDIKSIEDFGAYLDAVKKNEPNIIPWNLSGGEGWAPAAIMFGNNDLMAPGSPNCTSPVVLKKGDSTFHLKYTLDQPEVVDFAKLMHQWRVNGYWSQNTLSNTVGSYQSFQNGKSAAVFTNLDSANALYLQSQKEHPDWDVRVFPAYCKGMVDAQSNMAAGESIGAKSQNPERALMLLDLLRYNEQYQMLTLYGVQGKDYTLNDKGEVSIPADNGYPDSDKGTWGWQNAKFIKPLAGSIPNWKALVDDENARYFDNQLISFTLDTKDLTDVTTNIGNCWTQYGAPLYLGFGDDSDAAIATYKTKLDEAGVAKLFDATKSQIAQYITANNIK